MKIVKVIYLTKIKMESVNGRRKYMKKIAIVGASLALAAVPVVGVFAADDGSFTDNITVTVAGGCTMGQAEGSGAGSPGDRTFTASITNGTAVTLTGSGSDVAPALQVECNTSSATAFHITANPKNGGALVSGSNRIESRVAESGDNSAFMYKITGNIWLAAPTSAATVASGTASQTQKYSFNPSYRVFVSLGQPSGSYTGGITYTLAMGA